MPHKIWTLLTAGCTLVAVAGALPAVAYASRQPTSRERAAITRAAVKTDGSPTQRVRVSQIVVSTAGPWATATVSLYLKRDPTTPEMVSEETFYRSHGEWLDTNNAKTPERTPPDAVVQDLSLPANPGQNTGPSTLAYIIAGIIIVLIVALIIALVVRVIKKLSGGVVITEPPQQPRPQQRRQPQHPSTSSLGKRKCSCNTGTRWGKRYCAQYDKCKPNNGYVWVPDPTSPGRQMMIHCPTCGGKSEWTCPDCRGEGWV